MRTGRDHGQIGARGEGSGHNIPRVRNGSCGIPGDDGLAAVRDDARRQRGRGATRRARTRHATRNPLGAQLRRRRGLRDPHARRRGATLPLGARASLIGRTPRASNLWDCRGCDPARDKASSPRAIPTMRLWRLVLPTPPLLLHRDNSTSTGRFSRSEVASVTRPPSPSRGTTDSVGVNPRRPVSRHGDGAPASFSHRLEVEGHADGVHALPIGSEVRRAGPPGAAELDERVARREVELGVVDGGRESLLRVELHADVSIGRGHHLPIDERARRRQRAGVVRREFESGLPCLEPRGGRETNVPAGSRGSVSTDTVVSFLVMILF